MVFEEGSEVSLLHRLTSESIMMYKWLETVVNLAKVAPRNVNLRYHMRFETAQIGGSSLDILYFQKNFEEFVQQLNVITNLNSLVLEIFKHIEPYYEKLQLEVCY